ncbi:putative programmed cell death protein 2 [Trypanosoma rangeli]|uniref:Putative programmed cell death protein 2 n=1 Tax=Trypanosoma rangeli TaxID=5698 RepID=A0A3S5IS34_TRYRA|nr:putative programmed cell death protein 2 [Trypanosoma rangeli]RNF09786.1 putative programmed cell death protein 2 [Trypanosoma rangeli]|eukprot:RNF09786.1 putative programmed cell death protein 2 [Trypanosoma rangeli]
MTGVLLGIFDGYMPLERNALTSETKIGGTPTFFPTLSDAQCATIRGWTTCGVCGHPMFLLLQAFSPLPSASALHHRMIYIFCCNSAACVRQPSASWCAFALQLDAVDESALQDEQLEDVFQGDPLLPSELPPNAFPPCFVDIIPEPKKEIIVPSDLETELIRNSEKNAQKAGITEADVKELENTIDLRDKPSDYEFEKFRRRIAREPKQVLRYYVRDQLGKQENGLPVPTASPLFMNPGAVRDSVRIPSCSSCGAALTHELQLMPTCVYYLRVGEYLAPGQSKGDDGVDWGSVTVYVCSKDCSKDINGVVLLKAFVLVEKAPELEDEEKGANGRKSLRSIIDCS